ncbi:acyl--CoA ligase [Candidatus Gracilibacteria bacterium]|nr:acyl--CoA ligase [Candidatus Gracilibacteria bacterium]
MYFYRSHLLDDFLADISVSEEEIIIDTVSNKKMIAKDFYSEICRIADGLQKNGLQKGDTVIIFTKDSIAFSIFIIAILLIGGTVAIIDPEIGDQNLYKKISLLRPSFCIIDGIIFDILHLGKIGKYIHPIFMTLSRNILDICGKIIITSKTYLGKHHQNVCEWEHVTAIPTWIDRDESDDAIIVFTGGTTDDPKGVIHSLGSLSATIQVLELLIGESHIFYADLPHFILFGVVMQKQTIIGNESYSPGRIHDIFVGYDVDATFFAPYKIQQFITQGIRFPGCLNHMLIGSAPMYSSFLERCISQCFPSNTRITCVYGMTELLPIASIDAREKIDVLYHRGDILGKPFSGVLYKFGKDNELHVSAHHAMKGYFGKPPQDYIATGDLVSRDGDNLVMLGRKKDMVIRGNYNIYPSLYESIILSIPGVNDCALFGIHESDYNEQIILLVDSIFTDKSLFLSKLQSGKYSIDSFAIPDNIVFGSIPRFGRQKKINKFKLGQLYLHHKLGK